VVADGNGVVVRVSARVPDQTGPENELLGDAGVYHLADQSYHLHLADLGAPVRQGLASMLRAADEHGTKLELGLSAPPVPWYGPVLSWPVGGREPHGFVDPAGMTTMLVIDVRLVPGGPAYQWWLAGEPPMGTHPRPAAAWERLRRFSPDEDPFAPLPDGGRYAGYDGPQQASVRGLWRGRWIQTEFSRVHPGESARWDKLTPLLEPDNE
jgi:hypothetical protein